MGKTEFTPFKLVSKHGFLNLTELLNGLVDVNVSVSQIYSDFLKEERVIHLSHPPYSPDLSPCDVFLFPKLKKPLSGRRY